ncbi:MAG TPA: two-component regulator propeller domain-containing protein [Candidatus Hydrogenedentes bacterium]|nr:two-component regulator propeller domain-containing protein [Candidatus Hydrogenedentota bacterium]HRT20489.1 two-component regulator propeller domain-containing protein [Candidatus Hydrogenedentota bacterium]HRT65176.1 two-component regulator propeller domain-containing protein [Candidatus Hydrogenedentota bacterium]
MLSSLVVLGAAALHLLNAPEDDARGSWLPEGFRLPNIVHPFMPTLGKRTLPVQVAPFFVHVRGACSEILSEKAVGIRFGEQGKLEAITERARISGLEMAVNASVKVGEGVYHATDAGLYVQETASQPAKRHESYGVDGPPATRITSLAVDSRGTLWAGTPAGLGRRTPDGEWTTIRGRDGLPCENVTAIAVDSRDCLWIGTDHGAVFYKPYEEGRQWFYRAGKRYLPGNRVKAVAVHPSGTPAYFLTDAGLGRIDTVQTTLLEKAETIEKRINERHRRLGLVAECMLDNAENPTSHTIGDNDNDGLWTAYHVAAMSLCYGATKDESARASAQTGMKALYMLQDASGTPGLVARSMLPAAEGKLKGPQWRPTPDDAMYWKSDTSSDEIDGHYLAFYTYFEHIARHDPEERETAVRHVRALTDYIVDNGYRLIDWNGKRTRWGFWDPKTLNDSLFEYVEAGLNSLQMLSFLKVAHYMTGDRKYEDHYRSLIVDHHYLANVLLTKKTFPDSVNHSDDQLAFVAWYPILQLEKDPKVRRALCMGVQRHIQIVQCEQPSFYTFVYATVDPQGADIEGAVENLRQIPADRRHWDMMNSHRADVSFSPLPNRFGQQVLTRVLPADEREFAKWNADPYIPDYPGDGRHEDDGAAYLLPYWMGRYHGFIEEQSAG